MAGSGTAETATDVVPTVSAGVAATKSLLLSLVSTKFVRKSARVVDSAGAGPVPSMRTGGGVRVEVTIVP